jgi:formylglycine-generating enzyme
MRFFITALLFIGCHALAYAQDEGCYTPRRQKGIEAYESKDYDKAIKRWQTVLENCTDIPYNHDLNAWIAKAEAAKKMLPYEPDMVFVQGGTFQMGSDDGKSDSDEKPVHSVTISNFYMGKTEVTNEQFCTFLNEKGNLTEGETEWVSLCGGSYEDEKCRISKSGSRFVVESGYEKHPIIYVSWYGSMAYSKWLSEKTTKNYRLPTEAEWEFAAGNGSKHTKYSWGNGNPLGKNGGNVVDETAKKKFPTWNFFSGYTDGYIYTAPVASFNPNDLGLYDMTGNVKEWCSDLYDKDYYKNSPSQNPKGAQSSTSRVLRGGSWADNKSFCSSTHRLWYGSSYRIRDLGFRVARD